MKRPLTAETLVSLMEAFASGDALGMPTEFMTRGEIQQSFGLVDRLLDAGESKNHGDLEKGRITDDTEQVLCLLDEYALRGRVDARETAARLLRWVKESGAVEKRYIGPSSRAALQAIEGGADPCETGRGGTTCGGVMRSPAAALFALSRDLPLDKSLHACLIPTHNTRPALEAALAYAYALREALAGGAPDSIIGAALRGAEAGIHCAPQDFCGPSLSARLELFQELLPGFSGPGEVLDFLYGVFGTGLESVDVAAAVLCIFLYAEDDCWLCLHMGASVGGDTDTIAALSGMLSAAHCAAAGRGHNIPREIVQTVKEVNGLDLAALAARVAPR